MKVIQIDAFHNTVFLLPSEKAEQEVINVKQNERVLQFFNENPDKEFTPSEVFLALGQRWPLTSIRRSCTDLTKMGDLEIADGIRRKGINSGDRGTEGCWKLKPKTNGTSSNNNSSQKPSGSDHSIG